MDTNPARQAIAMNGAFDDAVFQSQAVFRAAMDAMAHPGRIVPVAPNCAPPAPLSPMAGALALTLMDQDTPLWLDKSLREPEVEEWLSFQTGAMSVDYPADAAFALIGDTEKLLSLENFAQGTQDYPDRSTTIICQVPDLAYGRRLVLSGPGIETRQIVAPSGLSEFFVIQWQANMSRFPRGVDVLLVAPDAIVGLPRTVRISTEE
jgi:alpha-D-ribose 1-methylphosphonate 5-triphosphate synthase subunit PhnH